MEQQKWDKISVEAGSHPGGIIWWESSIGWGMWGGERGQRLEENLLAVAKCFFMFRNSFVYIRAIILYYR